MRCHNQINKFNLLCLVILVLKCKPTNGVTFENVSVILKWRSGGQDTKTITIVDDSLRTHVGEFGEVLIQNQNIPKLARNSVSNLPKVTHLHLTSCKIKKIEPGSFKNLPSLTDLNLSGNLLTEISNGIFDNLNFRTLYLENNKISKIENHAFNNLKMAYLFMDDNRISAWKSEWFLGTPLASISMSNNFLQKLPRLAFEFLWHFRADAILENFILSGNHLDSIDPDAFEGVKIILSLNLQNNSLTHLEPGLFDTVEMIDQIDLSHNKLTQIYYETFRRTSISQINVYNNSLTCISPDIFNASGLNSINVGNNPISCDCEQTWREWKRTNEKPEINGAIDLTKMCAGSAGTRTSVQIFIAILFFLWETK